tara:strand:+ start:1769 stop:1957 length:189 start_codon:yes stop_codon:yes gene_type:complete
MMSSSNTSSLPSINDTKVVPENKHIKIEKTNNKKFKHKTDLSKLRKSKPFRDLGDAFDYFSD